MLYERTKLDNKHIERLKKNLSLSLSLSLHPHGHIDGLVHIIYQGWDHPLLCHGAWLEDFISPLMSRAFEFTIISICFDRPLPCRIQLYNKPWEHKISSFEQKLKSSDYELITNQVNVQHKWGGWGGYMTM